MVVSVFDFGECLGLNTGVDALSQNQQKRLDEIWNSYRAGVVGADGLLTRV